MDIGFLEILFGFVASTKAFAKVFVRMKQHEHNTHLKTSFAAIVLYLKSHLVLQSCGILNQSTYSLTI